jgi:hypothetical protein
VRSAPTAPGAFVVKRTLTRKQTVVLWAIAVTLVAAVALAWSLEYFASQSDEDVYTVSVVRDEEVVRVFDLEELRDFDTRQMEMQGEVQEGPPLLDVLGEAGVTDFSSVTIVGAGLRDSGRIVLKSGDIDENVLLDFSSRGTVKVCGPEIVWEDRVRDVERIEVR